MLPEAAPGPCREEPHPSEEAGGQGEKDVVGEPLSSADLVALGLAPPPAAEGAGATVNAQESPRGAHGAPRSFGPSPEAPAKESPVEEGARVVKGKGFALEIFAGSARLSRALRRRGVDAYGVDHKKNRHRPQAPMVIADLTTETGREVVEVP